MCPNTEKQSKETKIFLQSLVSAFINLFLQLMQAFSRKSEIFGERSCCFPLTDDSAISLSRRQRPVRGNKEKFRNVAAATTDRSWYEPNSTHFQSPSSHAKSSARQRWHDRSQRWPDRTAASGASSVFAQNQDED